MEQVWKYARTLSEIARSDGTMVFEIPQGAELVSVREQRHSVALWFKVDALNKTEERRFGVVGTGHYIPDHHKSKVLGSCHFEGGDLILHVFEIIKEGT